MIWNILNYGDTGPIVFYFSDKDFYENEANGISKMVGEDCFLILEKYNEVKFLTRENADIAFDSKERFDLNFQGIMHHYYGRKI